MIERNFSLRRFFCVPTIYVFVVKYEVQVSSLCWMFLSDYKLFNKVLDFVNSACICIIYLGGGGGGQGTWCLDVQFFVHCPVLSNLHFNVPLSRFGKMSEVCV